MSKGQKQRVVIAAAMLHEPKLLLLDEPLNGLDVDATTNFKEVLAEFAAAGGAVLYTSHLVDVMERFVPRVIIIRDGEQVADSPMDKLLASTKSGTLSEAFTHATVNSDIHIKAE